MIRTIKIAVAISAVFASSTAMGVTGLDRLVFSPSFLFEEGNFAELTLANSQPSVSPDSIFNSSANVADDVNTVRFSYKHQFNDKFGLGLMVNTQPIGVDVDYEDINPLFAINPASPINTLRGSVSARSYIALGHYQASDRISAFGGIKYQTQEGDADLTSVDPTGAIPGATNFKKDSDTGAIIGAAYSIPKIAFRASLTYESSLEFDHDTIFDHPLLGDTSIGNTRSATPDSLTLEVQSGIAKDTLLFGSIRRAEWSDSQVIFLTDSIQPNQLSTFTDTTEYKLGVGRKFTDAISGSVTLNYERSTGRASSPFSPQDGERGIAIGGKYTAKNGFATSVLVQYRKLGDTVTTIGIPFEDNDVVTVGLKLSKSF